MGAMRWLVVTPGTDDERAVPITRRLLVGRDCVGVARNLRLLVEDPSVSRDHFEVRVDDRGAATLVDLSTNGTRVNGRRVVRGRALELRDGDLIEIGATRLEFRAVAEPALEDSDLRATIDALAHGRLTLVAGDPLAALTQREREIVARIAQGDSNATIAERFSVSIRTVEAHVRNIMLELGLPETNEINRRVHLVLAYLRATAGNASVDG